MAEVTDGDRERGRQYWLDARYSDDIDGPEDVIAQAIAEERERVRAPFQRLADEIEAACRGRQDVVSMTMRDDVALIRATLDDNQ